MTDPIAAWRTSYLTSSMTFAVPGTVVAASVGTGPVARVASGDAVLGSEQLEVDDAFHIGSMTKLFTAALIMQLDQEGVLSLDDTLDRWYPEAPNASAITVRMLLQHESGLAELDFDLVGTATTQQVIDDVFAQPPVSPPGTAYAYLNAGYIILGSIAEKATGSSYDTLIQTRFIGPLGLTNTYLDGAGTGPAAVDGFDLGCAQGTGGDCLGKPSTATPVTPTPSPQWVGAFSAGGMVSTAHDQAVWIRDLVAGDVLDAPHRAEMQTLTPLSSNYYGAAYAKAGVPAIQLGEGTGLASWAVPGVGTCYGHAGSIPGSNGIAAFCPDTDLAIVILNDLNPAGLTPGYPGLLELAPPALHALTGNTSTRSSS
ncbi:serine hydrolase domain-containing protein [Subtercola sp. YIM 133946]|uniref:serine hydrolase domain-containing protein n=1 Tax=Subtercola sp. YIM 133946 TaxID=3118909 RepID=UPI002F92499E